MNSNVLKQYLIKDKISMILTLFKDTTGCYKYSIEQTYKGKENTLIKTTEFAAGSMKSNAVKTFEGCITRMVERGYTTVSKSYYKEHNNEQIWLWD